MVVFLGLQLSIAATDFDQRGLFLSGNRLVSILEFALNRGFSSTASTIWIAHSSGWGLLIAFVL